MNVCCFIGRVGKDAVVRHTQGGEPVAGWSLATDAGYGERKVTTWVDCSLWGKRAEALADKIRKGDRLGVSGELSTREHDGKTYLTLKVAEVTLLSGKPQEGTEPQRGGGSGTGRPARQAATQGNDEPFRDDDLGDIPFVSNRSVW